ncbi:transcriptional regulator PpsR [Acuticoccus sp.]|uniref:transcriptional regulator PpsR n=1 Tax=Acuticoccus sp. TaxID=1904378 RepID=UPI003B515ED1
MAAIAKAADIALVVDSDGVVVDLAVNASELLKAPVLSWIGRAFDSTVTVESREKVDALLADTFEGLRRWRHVNHPNGEASDIPVEYALIHLGDDGAKILAGRELSGLASLQQRLVLAQQSMEREYARVRGTEARYRLLFHQIAEAVIIADAASERVIEANPAAVRLFDLTPAEVGSASLTGLFSEEARTKVRDLLSEVRATGTGEEVAGTTASGRPVALHAALFTQATKSFLLLRVVPEGAGGSEPSPRLAEIIDRMPEGFVICDADGRVLSANAAFVELTQHGSVVQLRGEPVSRWLGRTGIDAGLLFGALREEDAVRNFATVLRGELGASEDVEVAAVAVREPQGGEVYALSVRTVRPQPWGSSAGLERSVQQLTELVGRVPLKDLVRDATDLIERLCIEAALRLTENNRASAAEVLGLSRQSLYNKMRRYELGALDLDGEG